MEFELDFHGHVGPCRICCLYSDIFLVVYMYVYIYIFDVARLTLCCRLRSVVSVFVLFPCSGSDFG